MKSTEFSGFICDGCGKPFTIEEAELTSIHVNGSIDLNNSHDGVVGEGDFHNLACFKRVLQRELRP